MEERPTNVALQRDAGIGQGEHRDDEKGDPGMQGMLHPLQGGFHFDASCFEGVDRGLLHLPALAGVAQQAGAAEAVEQILAVPTEFLHIDPRTGGDGHGQQHARDRSMHPGLQEGGPEPQPQQQVDDRMAHPEPVGGDQRQQEAAAERQAEPGDLGGVKQGNDQHGADVINDRQGGEEDLQRERYAAAQQGHHPQGKSDIRGHGDPPTGSAFATAGDQHVDARRHHHTTDGGRDRQRRLAQ